MNPKISMTRKGPGIGKVVDALDLIRRSDVLVGITQAKNQRPGEPIGNAALAYIHTHGSPARNIPARPIIEPAIEARGNKEAIAKELGDAAKALTKKDKSAAEAFLKRAGMAGRNAVVAWFTDPRNNWAPNSPATIRRKGSNRPLIDTGALRRSMTYVVRVVR